MEPTDTEDTNKITGKKPGEETESKLGSLLSRLRGSKDGGRDERSASSSSSPSSSSPSSSAPSSYGRALLSDSLDEESKVVTARGTEDGLVLRIDGKSPWETIIAELDSFLGSRRRFLEGGEVSIEWLERLPTPEQSFELEQYLREGFGVEVVSRRRRPAFTTIVDRSASRSAKLNSVTPLAGVTNTGAESGVSYAENAGSESVQERVESPRSGADTRLSRGARIDSMEQSRQDEHLENELDILEGRVPQSPSSRGSRSSRVERVLKDTIEILEDPAGPSYLRRVSKLLGEDLIYEEDANAKIVFGHFRSGQRLETPYSLVVIGDVNPGADLIAGGDIFVLGSLRGTAHAAAYDDEALDRVVVALSMQPVQLRIGSILSRGNGAAGKGPEVARIENRRIIVEAFTSKLNLRKKGA